MNPSFAWTCFNPHTHEGCDSCKVLLFSLKKRYVSIHTPTKGVTDKLAKTSEAYKVSIHTPTKGVTLERVYIFMQLASFNPHTHEGCDSCSDWIRSCSTCFNPHTHEGCDLNDVDMSKVTLRFNPHTHEGCDYICILIILLCNQFQSTHPRRVWPIFACFIIVALLFQSTHPRRVWPAMVTPYFLPL